jgi:hypothetical protein
MAGGVGTFDKIILGSWQIEGKNDGLYATSPGGEVTKIELYVSSTPVLLPTSTAPPAGQGATPPSGNYEGGGGASGSPTNATSVTGSINGLPPNQDFSISNSSDPLTPQNASTFGASGQVGAGTGYSDLSSAGIAALQRHGLYTPTFVQSLQSLCSAINVPSDNMVIVFGIECSLNPAAVNSSTGASGLNQIMPSVAASLGTSVQEIRSMTGEQQMAGPTTKYFLSWKNKFPQKPSLVDLYLINFYPIACGKPDNFVCGNPQEDGTNINNLGSRDKVASNNPAFKGPNGYVTVGSINSWIQANWQKKLS